MTQTTSSARAPDAHAILTVMRPLLRAVIRRPGRLYNPVYFGPMLDAGAVEAEARQIAGSQGVAYYLGGDPAAQWAWGQDQPGVFMCSVEQALALLAMSGGVVPRRRQMVVWGEVPHMHLPAPLDHLIGASVALDPSEYVSERNGESSMSLACARCAQNPGKSGNPLVLFGAPASLSLIVDEAQLRLEGGGLSPVLAFGDPRTMSDELLQDIGPGGAVVLRVVATDGGHEWVPSIAGLIARGVQVVMAADARLREEARSTPVGGLLVAGVSIGLEPRRAASRLEATPRWTRSSGWPTLADVMVGAPEVGESPARLLSAQGGGSAGKSFSFEDLVQFISSGQMAGRLVVYSPSNLGYIEFSEGSIVAAGLEGDPWDVEALVKARGVQQTDAAELITAARALEIGSWRDAQMVLVSGGSFPDADDSGRVRLSADKYSYDLALWLDEAPRYTRKAGGLGRVWRPADSTSAPKVGQMATRLWSHLGPGLTLKEVSFRAGLMRHESIRAVADLLAAGAIVAVEERQAVDANLPPAGVVNRLCEWGLAAEAKAMLESLADDYPDSLSGREWFFLGHLRAGSDPTAASMSFRRAVETLGRESAGGEGLRDLLVGALLNVLVLEVRTRSMAPEMAWTTFRDKVEPGASRHLTSARHLAVVLELALRAGEDQAAAVWAARLRSTHDPDSAALVRAFDRLMATGAEA